VEGGRETGDAGADDQDVEVFLRHGRVHGLEPVIRQGAGWTYRLRAGSRRGPNRSARETDGSAEPHRFCTAQRERALSSSRVQ
jgi:hypothetical protein